RGQLLRRMLDHDEGSVGAGRERLPDEIQRLWIDKVDRLAVTRESGTQAVDAEIHLRAVGHSNDTDAALRQRTESVIEDVLSIAAQIRPGRGTLHQALRVRSVETHFVQSGMFWICGAVDDPAVRRGDGILGVEVVIGNLARRAAVALRHPDLKMAASIGTPD